MKKHLIAAAAASLVLSGSAVAQRVVDGGYVKVEENIANPRYPTHYISVPPEKAEPNGSEGLSFRCENNSTDVWVNTDGVYGHDGVLRVRWQGMDRATRISSTDATTGTAAFIDNPIGFVPRLLKEGSVILEVDGYTTRGAARYRITPDIVDAIYDLAETCEWVGRLPAREAVAAQVEETESTVPEIKLVKKTLPTIRQVGKERFLEILDELMPDES